ncbi:MAG: CBS domain-containing protein [Synechococcus sp.]
MKLNDPGICSPNIDAAIDRQPLTVSPETSLQEVVALMSGSSGSQYWSVSSIQDTSHPDTRSSCALVVKDGQPIGIFTERDIVRLTAQQLSLSETSIGEVMTQPVTTLPLDDFRDIFAALFLFRRYRIRHLPIVDDAGQLVGVVSPERLRRVLRPANLLKMRRVADVMASEVVHAPPTHSVLNLAQAMSEHRVSCVVIAETQDEPNLLPVGIVTERDIVQFQALGIDLARTPAKVVMSSPLELLEPEDSLWTAHQKMQELRVRRLVVSWNWGRDLGIVTQTSLLRVFNPMEMFGIVETLQHTVVQLEAERDSKRGSRVIQSVSPEQLDRSIAISEINSSGVDFLLEELRTKIQTLIDTPTLSLEQRQQGLLKIRQIVESLQHNG